MSNDDFKKMMKELQKHIEKDEEKAYSEVVISEYRNPTYFGVIEHPDAVGIIKGPCGDTMKITLEIVDERIIDARFWTDGCGATLACGNRIIKMIKGITLQQVNAITHTVLLDELEGLPKEHEHCALLAVNTLHEAIKKYKHKGV